MFALALERRANGDAWSIVLGDAHSPSRQIGSSVGQCVPVNPELENILSGMVAGRIDHPKEPALSDADVRNFAAYISSRGEAQ